MLQIASKRLEHVLSGRGGLSQCRILDAKFQMGTRNAGWGLWNASEDSAGILTRDEKIH